MKLFVSGVSIGTSKRTRRKLLVLDTDHSSEWERGSAAGLRLRARLEETRPDFSVAIVTVEEQMRGWFTKINRQLDVREHVTPYAKLQRQVEIFGEWIILPWDAEAADLFLGFRRQGVRIGTLDLKIACIVLAHDATLLTRNTSDFAKVPGLRFENWLE